jgi:hypothetical protein
MAVLSRDTPTEARTRALDVARLLSTPWVLVPILLAAFVVYAPTLADWFTGDDFWFLRAAQQHSVADEIGRSLDYRNVGSSLEFDRYRPLYPIAWRLEYAAFGTHALPYHAVVLVLHLACVAAVWAIARRLFRESWAASLAAIIFALHPAYMDAVAWVSGGNRVFAELPALLALLCYMRALDGGERHTTAWQGAALALFVLAVGMHSAALTMAAVIVAYRFLLAGEPRDALQPRAWIPFTPYAFVIGASAAVQAYVRTNIGGAEEGFRFGYHQYANYGELMGMALQPIEPSNASGAARTLLADARGAGSVLLLLAAVALVARWRERRLALFLAAWFFVALLPDSTLILGPSGRLLYMPGPALAMLLVAVLAWLRDELPDGFGRIAARAMPYACGAAIPLVMLVTYGRTRGISHDASRNQIFVERLQSDVPAMPAGALYVAGVPKGLITLGESTRLDAAVELYYGDARVVYVPSGRVAAVRAAMNPDDQFYDYAAARRQ